VGVDSKQGYFCRSCLHLEHDAYETSCDLNC